MTPSFFDSWSPGYRRLGYFLGIVFLFSLIAGFVSYLVYPWPVFSWQQLQELQPQELPLYSFERGNLEFTLTGENYLLFERWLGNTIQSNLMALDVYFVLFGLSIAVLLAIVSALPRFWFYIGGMVMTFLIALLQWEALEMGGSVNQFTPTFVAAAFLLALVFFQFFNKSASLMRRSLVFTGLCAIIAGVVVSLSPLSQPLRFLAVHTMPSAIILAIVFVIMVSHQIIATFVTLAQASSKKHSLVQFLLISGIYLLNLWLAYLSRIGWMSWDYTIPSYLLFTVSALLTVWTIRQREAVYESILPSYKLIVAFILSLGTVAFATIGFMYSTANDIVLLSLNDLILYIHIAYGMMFILYMASNFLPMFETNLPISVVLYKPRYMPYFSYRLAGLVFTLALVFYNNWQVHLNHFTSGYYTAMGDLHFNEPSTKAFHFYHRGHFYGPYNKHAATALSVLEGASGNYGKEISYADDANLFQPSEFTILNSDYLYLRSGNSYHGVQLLRKGKSLFPGSGVISNNLGLSFTRADMVDSARFYFTEAKKDRRTRNSAEMNLLGLIAKTGARNSDSVDFSSGSISLAVKCNAIAVANQQGKLVNARIDLPKDSILNLFSSSLIANYLTNQTNQVDTAFLLACIRIARKNENLSFRHLILQSAATACYASGQVNRAIGLLQEIVFLGVNQGANNYMLGLMAMDQDKHDVAISSFLYALNYKSSPAALAIAVSLAEEGLVNEAIVAWDSVSQRKDTTLRALGESMKRVLAAPDSWFKDLTETEKLYFALYRIQLEDSIQFNRLVNQIKNEDLRAKAFLNRARKYHDVDEPILASRQFNHLQGLHLTDTRLFAEIKYFELRLLASQRRMKDLDAIIAQGILFGPYRQTERVYFEALKYEAAGDKDAAGKSYDWLADNNWYFDDGIVAAAKFFRADNHKAYNILSDALQVNPHSVKILKAYIPVALASGFDPYAAGALETLRGVLSPTAFKKYVAENHLDGLLSP